MAKTIFSLDSLNSLYALICEILSFFGLAYIAPVLYIEGGKSLPAPLKPEREAFLLSRLTSAENNHIKKELIEHNLRLVVYIARKFESSGTNIEDLISIGTIGLIKAINTFCPDRGIKLATYASRCIENEILMHLRKISPLRSEMSFDEPLNTDWDGNELLLSDILGTDEDITIKPIEDRAEKDVLLDSVSRLPARERTIIIMRYGLYNVPERTQKEVASILGISQSYISRLEKRIIAKLRREIAKQII